MRAILRCLAALVALTLGVALASAADDTRKANPMTDSPTQAGNTALVTGRVLLQGRTTHNGVYVTLDGGESGFDESKPDGSFTIRNITLGWHILRMDMPKYLAVEGRFLAGQETTVLGDLVMLGGDAYGDNVIDILDLALVARNYDTSPPADDRADINANGAVDIYDLTLVSRNYDRRGPTDGQNRALALLPETLSSVAKERQQRAVTAQRAADPNDPTVSWSLEPARTAYKVGEVVTVTLSLDQAAKVYGVDVAQSYDAKQLRPRDANRATPAVDTQLGDLFSHGFAPVNKVEGGALRVGVSQVDNGPLPDRGVVLRATFEVIGCGETVFDAKGIKLTDGKANAIPVNIGTTAVLKTACP